MNSELAKLEQIQHEIDDLVHQIKGESDLNEELNQLAELMRKHRDRFVFEDTLVGDKFSITRVKVIGTRTDDPGIVVDLHLERS